jgi:5-methylcytosine-specific restriction endonuclease McrA
MKKHVKNYMRHYKYGEQDIIFCGCGQQAVDIHHIKLKSCGGTDDVENLIALCRKCHDKAHGLN